MKTLKDIISEQVKITGDSEVDEHLINGRHEQAAQAILNHPNKALIMHKLSMGDASHYSNIAEKMRANYSKLDGVKLYHYYMDHTVDQDGIAGLPPPHVREAGIRGKQKIADIVGERFGPHALHHLKSAEYWSAQLDEDGAPYSVETEKHTRQYAKHAKCSSAACADWTP